MVLTFWLLDDPFFVWVSPQKIEGAPGDLLMTRRILKTSSSISFVMSVMSVMPVIDVASYHPAPAASLLSSSARCKGRRTDPDHADRNFKPYIYAAYQCGGYAVDWSREESWFLCATCEGHRQRGVDWHGRINEPLDRMPITSHIAGGPWFTMMMAEGKFKINDRPLTAKQEGRLARAPVVPEAQLMRFARGEIDLDIETLAAKRQISAQNLWNIIGAMGIVISRKVRSGTKAGLCAAIRAAMASPAPSAPPAQHFNSAEAEPPAGTEAEPQHFNPEEDNYEPEIQYMAPAGDSAPTGDESPLNTAFYEEQEEQEEQPEQGGGGGWLADEVAEAEAEAEAGPRRAARRTLVPNWGLIPSGAAVRWVIKTPDRTLVSSARYATEGRIEFHGAGVIGPAAFIKHELAIWKSNGRLPADMKPPHNAWKALEFERNGAWARFDSIRTAVEV